MIKPPKLKGRTARRKLGMESTNFFWKPCIDSWNVLGSTKVCSVLRDTEAYYDAMSIHTAEQSQDVNA